MILDAGAIFVSSNFLFQKISLLPSCNKILIPKNITPWSFSNVKRHLTDPGKTQY